MSQRSFQNRLHVRKFVLSSNVSKIQIILTEVYCSFPQSLHITAEIGRGYLNYEQVNVQGYIHKVLHISLILLSIIVDRDKGIITIIIIIK